MAGVVTLGDLVVRARRRAKMENSDFIDDSEIKELLLASVARVRERLHMGGQEWDRFSMELNTTPGQPYYPLPSDFFRALAVIANSGPVMAPPSDVFITSNSTAQQGWSTLRPFMMQELGSLLNGVGLEPRATRYRTGGQQAAGEGSPLRWIELRPTPATVWTLRVEYLTATNIETADFYQIDGINGFEVIPVLEAAIHMLAEEESDTSGLERQLARQEERLDAVAAGQDRTRPETIVDVEGISGEFDPYGLSRGGYWR